MQRNITSARWRELMIPSTISADSFLRRFREKLLLSVEPDIAAGTYFSLESCIL